MATYLKRTSKLFDSGLAGGREWNLRDLMCPVCRGILIEPVTLPCAHSLCLGCLNGTFEHNSLSCPLCRVRVGSWLRTATKSETLVNSGLWELIKTRFAKEVQAKRRGEDSEPCADSGFVTTTNKILSAAGEIRREYEAQLQMAEEEIRRQREAERIASEALIRKIQAEERQQLVQLAQDQLLAKTLAKTQAAEKDKVKCFNENPKAPGPVADYDSEKSKSDRKMPPLANFEPLKLEPETKTNLVKSMDGSEPWKSNIALISKIRAERYASGIKSGLSNIYKNSPDKFCCQKSIPIHNAVTRTLKHQAVRKMTQPSCSNYISEPSCSNSKIYGTQSKEELHVPSDVLSSKKKSLGVEVCVTTGEDDERIGSAESSGSHDSINQEIHHFKPIKAMPRTPLRISSDGRQIDPKLIRVVAVLKRIPNATLKPPPPTHLKRSFGCSWSAFRGKARQDSKTKETLHRTDNVESEAERQPSTSQTHSQSSPNKIARSQTSDTVRRLHLAPEISFDSNKNYSKNIKRIINGTKVSKKLILDEGVESEKMDRLWKGEIRNGMTVKSKRPKNLSSVKMDVGQVSGLKSHEEDELQGSSSSFSNAKSCSSDISDEVPAVENIAERIKKRKMCMSTNSQSPATLIESPRKPSTRRKPSNKQNVVSDKSVELEEVSTRSVGQSKRKRKLSETSKPEPKTKRSKIYVTRAKTNDSQAESINNDAACTSAKSEKSLKRSNRKAVKATGLYLSHQRTTRNTSKDNDNDNDFDIIAKRSNANASKDERLDLDDGRPNGYTLKDNGFKVDEMEGFDEEIIKDQERLERLVLQEKEDFQLAQKLQAEFNDMERIAGRTRGSRRAIEVKLGTGKKVTDSAKPTSDDLSAPNGRSRMRCRPQRRTYK